MEAEGLPPTFPLPLKNKENNPEAHDSELKENKDEEQRDPEIIRDDERKESVEQA